MDKELLLELKGGSRKAFSILYNTHSGKLYNFIFKISKHDSYLAEEIVQDVFVKIWEMRAKIDPEKSFPSFVSTIAKNMLLNHYQHQMVTFLHNQKTVISQPQSHNDVEETIDYKLLDEYVTTLIDQLPEKRKEVFIMSRKLQMSNKEIALRLQISENTVESYLSKALLFIREKVKSNYMFVLIMLSFNTYI